MSADAEFLVIVGLVLLVTVLLVALIGLGRRTTEKAKIRFEEWRAREPLQPA